MLAQALPLLSLLALSNAIPFNGHSHSHLHRAAPIEARDDSTFDINIMNNCASDLEFGVFQVSSSFAMNTITPTTSIASGENGTISAPYSGIGMRLSGTAGAGAAAQWAAQALFEFGYSGWNGVEGTAYDLSVMGGDVGLAVYPANAECPSKLCTPTNCPLDQGWTNQDQVNDGSPADTVCYHGKTDFNVVWCADS